MLNGPLSCPCLIGPNSSAYFKAKLSGTYCTWHTGSSISKAGFVGLWYRVSHESVTIKLGTNLVPGGIFSKLDRVMKLWNKNHGFKLDKHPQAIQLSAYYSCT